MASIVFICSSPLTDYFHILNVQWIPNSHLERPLLDSVLMDLALRVNALDELRLDGDFSDLHPQRLINLTMKSSVEALSLNGLSSVPSHLI